MTTNTVVSLPSSDSLTARIAAALRGYMAERRITGLALARAMGISQSAMSRRMVGQQAFDTDELELAVSVLGVSIEELLERAARSPRPDGPGGGDVRHPRLELGTRWLSVCADQSNVPEAALEAPDNIVVGPWATPQPGADVPASAHHGA